MTTLAQVPKATLPPLEGIGPLGNFGNKFGVISPIPGFTQFEATLSVIIGVLTVSAGIWFVFQILAGAFQWLASGGEKQGVENARKRLTNAIVGLFIVVAAYTLISIVGLVFGINILAPAKSIIGTNQPATGALEQFFGE